MNNKFGEVAGALILVGAAQFLVGMIVSEALYSGYSLANNTISALGVGPSAIIFNSSVFLFGLTVVAGAYFIMLVFGRGLVPVLFFIAGVGAMSVGMFPSNTGVIHDGVSLIIFLFGGLSAISAYRL